MREFASILYLDDVRVPSLPGVVLVRSYAEFVEYLAKVGMPELISFDHDLAREHYPVGLNRAGETIPYSGYREKTGLDCARYVTENKLPLRYWAVHSSNVQGKINIERELRRYRRLGEIRGLEIPFEIPQALEELEVVERVAAPEPRRFSGTSLLQFQEEIALESWERGRMRAFEGRQRG